jgi:hypothetical protein
MRRLIFAAEVDVPGIVTALRDPRTWPDQQPPVVQPHHVTVGHDNIMGNPDNAPVAAAKLPPPHADRQGDGKGVAVGVCDTGIWRHAGAFHPDWLGGAYVPEADDEDPLYRYGDVLELQGGHGTFVAGVLRQAAPGVRFDPEAALADTGVGDEEMLVGALGRLSSEVAVVNLSLGYHTQDDTAPTPIRNVLDRLAQRAVVVASAGNAATSRPTWPAALPRVVGVAATARSGESVTPASYSNHGPWVTACADGTRTSTFVTGRLELAGSTIPFDGHATWSGTSFAAPYVAGRLAALMSAKGVDARAALNLLLGPPPWPTTGYGVYVP